MRDGEFMGLRVSYRVSAWRSRTWWWPWKTASVAPAACPASRHWTYSWAHRLAHWFSPSRLPSCHTDHAHGSHSSYSCFLVLDRTTTKQFSHQKKKNKQEICCHCFSTSRTRKTYRSSPQKVQKRRSNPSSNSGEKENKRDCREQRRLGFEDDGYPNLKLARIWIRFGTGPVQVWECVADVWPLKKIAENNFKYFPKYILIL